MSSPTVALGLNPPGSSSTARVGVSRPAGVRCELNKFLILSMSAAIHLLLTGQRATCRASSSSCLASITGQAGCAFKQCRMGEGLREVTAQLALPDVVLLGK